MMTRMISVLCLGVVLTGCPDVDKYAKDAEVSDPDAVVVADLGVARDAEAADDDQGLVSEDLGLADSGASSSDGGEDPDADPSMADAGQEIDGALAVDGSVGTDTGVMVPETCEVSFQVALPEGTPEDDPVYLAGAGFGLQDWEPGLDALRLTDDGLQRSLLRELPHLGRVSYKYTRGTWETVETTVECAEIIDRVVVVDCLSDTLTVQDEVLGWVDRCQ